jgi:hypothetical protein
MDLTLRTPPVLQGNERQQLQQIRSYLFQMQQQLTVALDSVFSGAVAQEAAALVRGSDTLPDGERATIDSAYRKLKSLIIKTADTVTSQVEELRTTLEKDYVAQSTFGSYTENAAAEFTATAEAVVQSYEYDSKLAAAQGDIDEVNAALGEFSATLDGLNGSIGNLETYNVSTQQYIKTGLLFFDDENIPRYGVAVGEKLTTVVVNGEVTVERSGLSATFTSDRLSFWQNEVEVAYISNKQLYINEANILSRLFIGDWVIDRTYGFTVKWAGA